MPLPLEKRISIVEAVIQHSEQTLAGRMSARRTAEKIIDTLDYQEALLLAQESLPVSAKA